MLKASFFAVVAVLSVAGFAQAQSYYTYYYPTYQPSPIQFDAQTRVLTINGTSANDDVSIALSYNRMVVTMNTPTQTFSDTFGGNDVSRIVFNGSDGDDSFEFENVYAMRYYKMYYGMFDIECDLNGGNGLDYLSGGVNDDLLNGGADGCRDVLIGNEGGDLFVTSRTLLYSNGYYSYYSYENELCVDMDEAEGDLQIFEDELDEFLNPSTPTYSIYSSLSLSTSLYSY